MLRLKSFTEDHDRSMVHLAAPTSALRHSLSLRVRILNTQTLAHMLDSLVRVSRRVGYNHFVRIMILQLNRNWQSKIAPQSKL